MGTCRAMPTTDLNRPATRLPAILAILAGLIALFPAVAAGAEATATGTGAPAVSQRDAEGEACAVCGLPLGPGDRARMVRGRWVPLHHEICEASFDESSGAAFAALQPRGALFSEEYPSPSALRWGWFAVGSWVLAGLLCGALCAHFAWPRRRSPAFWFAMGMIFNLLAVLVLLMAAGSTERMPSRLGKIPVTSVPAACPGCGALNHPAAARCADCGGALEAAYQPETRRAGHA